ncbi:HAMP domain-containing sensor histidine kinase [Thioclava sp. SK-1]|uniref:sensor histidine kinase n=1 Tax=Thioclava sp. SK-1 TaxID=1889770 RepID=UPI00159F2238|nr:histidine kinase dimerization/phospho-acceptor domain-containing protein [Thioclava sp. SK-1]
MTWRIAALVGLAVTLLWLVAALVTVAIFSREMNRVFDNDLKATAQRILPIVLRDRSRDMPLGKLGGGDRRDDDFRRRDPRQLVERLDRKRDTVEFVIRDASGAELLASANSAGVDFPPPQKHGFTQDRNYRYFCDRAPNLGITITVAEPLNQRRSELHEVMLGMSAPLLVVVPLSFFAILFAVRRSLRPVGRLSGDLARRGPQRLDALSKDGMVNELRPIIGAINGLMGRLDAAFESERSFAANAAHEMRTPVAGAIAQAQRLRTETQDPKAAARAADIEATLKRLSRLSEKLMQMARAEGARLRINDQFDLRMVLGMVIDDFTRLPGGAQIELSLPDTPVLSDLDPDAFGILARNLTENALRHGTADQRVDVGLTPDGKLIVRNDCAPLSPEVLSRVSDRFARGDGAGDGTGLGLAIAHVIAERAEAELELRSPLPGTDRGFEACFDASPLPPCRDNV